MVICAGEDDGVCDSSPNTVVGAWPLMMSIDTGAGAIGRGVGFVIFHPQDQFENGDGRFPSGWEKHIGESRNGCDGGIR